VLIAAAFLIPAVMLVIGRRTERIVQPRTAP